MKLASGPITKLSNRIFINNNRKQLLIKMNRIKCPCLVLPNIYFTFDSVIAAQRKYGTLLVEFQNDTNPHHW